MYKKAFRKGYKLRTFEIYDYEVLKAFFYISNRGQILPFDQLIEEELKHIQKFTTHLYPGFIQRGLYYQQITNYLQHFPRDQILIFNSQTLLDDTLQILDKINSFLDIKPWFNFSLKRRHVTEYDKSSINKTTENTLKDFFKPHNYQLYQLTGVNYEWD